MKNFNHWLICLDLSKMDDVLIGYTHFLASVMQPSTITFLHVVNVTTTLREITEQFPEISNKEEFDKIIRDELNDRIHKYFDTSESEIRLIVKEGKPLNNIIDIDKNIEPDLLIMGQKVGYAGEGVVPKRIVKYVPTPMLFIPENTRWQLKNIIAPVDFSEQSANAVKVAQKISDAAKGTVFAQHIYEYRAQYFPYILSEEEKEKTNRDVLEKKKVFVEKYGLTNRVEFILSRMHEGKLADYIYEQVISRQADMIIVGSKSKKFSGLLRHDFTDKMINYAFGIPVFILKNKEKYGRLLQSVFA